MKSTAIQGAANLLASVPRAQGKAVSKVPEMDFSVVINQTNFQNQETLQDSSAKLTEKSSGVNKTSDDKRDTWTEKAEKNFEKAEKPEARPKEEAEAASEDQNVTGQKESNLQDIPEETVSKVEDFLSKVREAFQDGFSMTEEELLSALEQLGFTMMDLMNPATLNTCIQALSGAQDSMALLVDEQLYTTCTQVQKEVMALTEVLGEEVQLTTEEMELVLSKLEEMQEAGQFNEVQSEILPEDVTESEVLTTEAEPRPAEIMENMENNVMEKSAEPMEKSTEPMEKSAEPVVTERESTAAVAVSRNQAEPKTHKMEENKDEPKVTPLKPTVEKLQESKQGSSLLQQNLSGGEHQNQPGMQLAAEPILENVFDADAAFTPFTTYDGSYESIIRQVAEQIHVQVTADTSSMEMQLNPESLGRLTLSVELKQGMLTARFIAENEQVKEAIENQAAVLREDLDRQGVKVEAIEVAVETHEFERNLEQGQQQNQAEEEARNEQSRRSSRRNLNLDILEEEEELELTEAEDLAAKIMRENGNTMDYFA